MIKGIDYPEWMDEHGIATLQRGYLLEGENVYQAYDRVINAASKYVPTLYVNEFKKEIKRGLENGWLCLATPVFSNMGTERGLPISCYGIDVHNSINSIGGGVIEMMKLTQSGGGVGVGFDRLQGKGTKIKRGGVSDGVVPYAKIYDSAIIATSQGGVRRGAASINLGFSHADFPDFLKMRRPHGDINTQCLNINHCAIVTDEDMENVLTNADGGKWRKLWLELLRTRDETGQPYIMFKDTINRANPQGYKDRGLEVQFTNICTEITLATDEDHSFVCCLSSLNLEKWDEWKDTKLPYYATFFLDAVLSEFIYKVGTKLFGSSFDARKPLPSVNYEELRENLYLYKVLNFAMKSRAIGLGVLGWSAFLQSKNIPYISLLANSYTRKIFSTIKKQSEEASLHLAEMYGEPEWCKGTGFRHTHRTAIAPTISNATIVGSSHSCEPYMAVVYNQKSAKGVFVGRVNKYFKKLMQTKYPQYDTEETYLDISKNNGSVQHLNFLSEEEKEVFLTMREINQLSMIKQYAIRQEYIDQAQPLNLAFRYDTDSAYINKCHIEAWKLGIKTLYYMRGESVRQGDTGRIAKKTTKQAPIQKDEEGCTFCEG